MKRIIFTLLICVLSTVAVAQHHPNRPGTTNPTPRHQAISVTFQAERNEAFVVYVDGDIVNRNAQTLVNVTDLSRGQHEFNIVLQRPADKIVTFYLNVDGAMPTQMVSYDVRGRQLTVRGNGTPTYPYNPSNPGMRGTISTPPTPPTPPRGAEPLVQPMIVEPARMVKTNVEMNTIIASLRNEPFDDSRLQLAKVALNGGYFTSEQISSMVSLFSFENDKLEFLKYAYSRVIDPENFIVCVQQLSFKSSRDELIAYIGVK